jgi:hypothetical protein
MKNEKIQTDKKTTIFWETTLFLSLIVGQTLLVGGVFCKVPPAAGTIL